MSDIPSNPLSNEQTVTVPVWWFQALLDELYLLRLSPRGETPPPSENPPVGTAKEDEAEAAPAEPVYTLGDAPPGFQARSLTPGELARLRQEDDGA